MGAAELLLLAVGLSMDAFAVSVCKGLAMQRADFRSAAVCGAWFGGFQALMPTVGYFLGSGFAGYVSAATPWIAFVLLSLIGANMIRESVTGGEDEASAATDVKTMLVMAVATSIDALAVGITFACVPVEIIPAISRTANTLLAAVIIGAVTFVLSCIGVKAGSAAGRRYKSKAELTGGIILIIIGLKIILEHLFGS